MSGKSALEFTADRQKLEEAAGGLRWRPLVGHGGMECPAVNYYLADLILNKGDSQAFEALVDHTVRCAAVPPESARGIAMAAVNREIFLARKILKQR